MAQRSGRGVLVLVLVLAAAVGTAAAFDRLILGKRFEVSDRTGLEAKRKVKAEGKEAPSDIAILSNPTLNGALLDVITNGGTSRHDTYMLDASGWKASGTSYKYKGPTGGDGDPVRSVTLKRSSAGAVQLKVQIRGNVGIQEVKVVPPNPGDDGGVILDVIGGDRYCVAFGAGAGGNETRDSSLQWKIVGAVAQPGCPVVATTTTTSTVPSGSTSTTSTTLPGPSPLCPADTSRTTFAGGPGTSACHQFDGDQPACEKAFHIGGQCGPSSCFFDFNSGDCMGCGPNNEQQGRCVNTCTHGAPSCPGDATRTIFAGFSGSQACTNLSFSQSLCEKAFHIDGVGQPASCYYDTDQGECLGCGPNNLEAGECQNTCPVCEGDPTRTLFTGGPGNSGCHKFDGAQASCEGAFVFSDSLAYNSCFFDAGSSECKGCGRNNQADQECINTCPVCRDTSRQIFLGGPGTSACSTFDNSPALCEQSFLMSGECNELASCFYDYENFAAPAAGRTTSRMALANGARRRSAATARRSSGSNATARANSRADSVCTFDCL
jgi:hypothetical protein